MLNTDRLCPGCMNDTGGERICPECGYDCAQTNPTDCLPARFVLGERYAVGRVLERGCEGITYLGLDTANGETVRIREYFPKGISRRFPDGTVSVSETDKFVFNDGLMDYLSLNRSLIGSELPALVPILAVFEENGTAYAVSQVISCITLRSFLSKNGGSLKWEQARPLFLPLIDTLAGLHENGILLGDISPDTVLVGRDGKMRFGNAAVLKTRYNGSGLPAELFPGFSAIEQYGSDNGELSFATDIYGLATTLFCVLIGSVPPEAPARLQKDSLAIPSHFAEELPRQVLVALANGMQVRPEARTATVEAFRNELVYGETAEQERLTARRNAANAEREVRSVGKGGGKSKKSGSGTKAAVIAAVCTAVVFIGIAAVAVKLFSDQAKKKNADDNSSSASDIMPDVPDVGDVDSNVAQTVTRYPVPDTLGKLYSEIAELEGADKLKFTIVGKEYSDKYQRGTICKQSVAADTKVERGTEIQVTISLGSKTFGVANVVGFTEDKAILELLKQGILYENIDVDRVYDTEKKPGVVLEQTPAFGTKISSEDTVQIKVNDYKGEDDESNVSSGSSGKPSSNN